MNIYIDKAAAFLQLPYFLQVADIKALQRKGVRVQGLSSLETNMPRCRSPTEIFACSIATWRGADH
ncbi:hypothetical protein P3339_21835 [Microbulbifer sp. MLAF003]|nr:hypothetical protein [Microbulbifer sp. MLAF003]WHI51009.1 hypothetical protein P3339_21835 [Microbulbifer sp. MLAF003]